MTQKAREDHLVNVARQGRRRGIREDGICSNGNSDLDAVLALLLCRTEVLRTVFMNMPVHARRILVVLLQTIHADVALASLGIFRKNERQRDEGAAVLGPALQDRQDVERRIVHLYDFLARRFLDVLGEVHRLAHLRDERDEIHLVRERDLRQTHEIAQIIGDLVKTLNAQSDAHAFHAAESVHEHGHVVALDVLEEQRDVLLALHLGNTVGDLGDFEFGVNLRLDAAQKPARFQFLDKLA